MSQVDLRPRKTIIEVPLKIGNSVGLVAAQESRAGETANCWADSRVPRFGSRAAKMAVRRRAG